MTERKIEMLQTGLHVLATDYHSLQLTLKSLIASIRLDLANVRGVKAEALNYHLDVAEKELRELTEE